MQQLAPANDAKPTAQELSELIGKAQNMTAAYLRSNDALGELLCGAVSQTNFLHAAIKALKPEDLASSPRLKADLIDNMRGIIELLERPVS
jgi:hypothetical protein